MKKWFYIHNNQEIGPLTDREIIAKIKAGELPETVLIRREDKDEYVPATIMMRRGPRRAPAGPAEEDGTEEPRRDREASPIKTFRPGTRGVVALALLVACAATAGWYWGLHLPRKRAEEAAAQKEREETEARRLADEAHAKSRAEELAKREAERKSAEEAAAKARRVSRLTEIGQSWTNGLGMKFVPVVGTKVLFCAHETRVQDYAAFIASTPRDWIKPSFPQEPSHPVVNVNWFDAVAFCNWLTAHERLSGRLGPLDEYRLPSDLGWSAAAGLLKEDGSTPMERHLKARRLFPWGTNWPPPKAAGNFAPSLGADDFEFTAPVMSFPPNQFGLHDLAGNVAEWCLDWTDAYQTTRVVRGGSFGSLGMDQLHSSYRLGKPPVRRMPEVGFRVVIYVAEDAPAASSP